ncbi:MAG TPA: nucleotidyltransferase family protein [Acidobacteriaceae bacterium]
MLKKPYAERTSDSDGIAAVVLAAGASRRLGEPKQLIQIEGESLLRRSVRLAVEAGSAPVLVVLGFAADRMRGELAGLAAEAIENGGWQEGMGSSLRCGVAAAAARPEVDGVLAMVCDQPRLTAEHLRGLMDLHRKTGGALTASFYGGRAGVPAVFGRLLFGELLDLQADRGARGVIEAHADQTRTIAWPEGEMDMDRPEQVRAQKGE